MNSINTEMFGWLMVALATASSIYTLVVAIGGEAKKWRWYVAGYTLTLLAFAIAAASYRDNGQHVVMQMLSQLVDLDRTVTVVFFSATLLGILVGVSLVSTERLQHLVMLVLYGGAIIGLCLLTLKDEISPMLVNVQASGTQEGTLLQTSAAAGLQVETLATLDIAPTCMALGGDNDLYVAGYAGIAFQVGQVIRVPLDGRSPPTIAVQSIHRPHGLAFYEGDLYVSHAGQYNTAVDGKLVQHNTGAVTRIQDIDSDGVFEHYTDVVSQLPGAWFPDGMHQNNGICFDANGDLFITVGTSSDHGPPVHKLEGTILRCPANDRAPQIYARGFRNAFGITTGPDGLLFCTDNDANKENQGDLLFRVVEGSHHGHPFTAHSSISVEGVVEPILKCSSAQGIAYAAKGGLHPGMDGCLYIAAYGDDSINRIGWSREQKRPSSPIEFVARVPTAIDVVYSSSGVLYACGHEDRTVYRIVSDGQQ